MSAGPQIELTSGGVLVLLGVVLGGLVLWRASRVASDAAGQAWEGIKDGAATVGGWVNPVSDQNLAYQGVNAVGGALTGEQNWSLGGAVYDWFNSAPAPAPVPIRSGGGGNFQGTGATGSWTDEQPSYFEQFGVSP